MGQRGGGVADQGRGGGVADQAQHHLQGGGWEERGERGHDHSVTGVEDKDKQTNKQTNKLDSS